MPDLSKTIFQSQIEPQSRVDNLVLVYTVACPLQCDFCCHAGMSFEKPCMETTDIVDWIYQAVQLARFRKVIFTGGEPFLYPEKISHVLKQTAGCGLGFRIVTSAFWAESVDLAKQILAPLVENGLQELSISTDPSHQKTVPPIFAEHAARAALDLGVECELVGVFWDVTTRVEDVVTVPPGARMVRRLAIPYQKQHQHLVSVADYGLGPERFFACGATSGYDVTIYPDATVYPCCSGGFNVRGKLEMGNLKQDSLSTIVERMEADAFTRTVLFGGLTTIYQLCEHHHPEIKRALPDPDSFLSPCQLCENIHADAELMKMLDPALHYADKIVSTVLELRRQAAFSSQRPEVVWG